MTSFLRAAGFCSLLTMLAAPVAAQWPDFPSPNVPLTSDGEPDLEAPPPRTADGHIDFTGVWGARFGGPGFGRRGNAPAAAADTNSPPVAQFFDIGAGMEGGAPMQDWARELKEQRMAEGSKDNPDAHCLPMGHMQFHLHPQPREMIQTENVLVILYEGNGGIRQIHLDGRTTPDNDPLPWWYGYSWGRWEGDELVVTTTHMKDTWLDVNGTPFTENGTIIERFRRPNFGSLEIDVTIDDPTVFTEPFTVRVNQRIMLNTSLMEFVCIENEQSSQYYD